ncbi:P-loop containing nucleoside triphosphate hydrolase protein [Suillus subalutaceus]|uniref:P-loop containing nucleoside triphosphate hydrolase protein n=1 Tax=Suillus subalutaceus TaxID=48586 RepID=UPI001B867F26|nr:P-loop containing nucleoside triphosphate hydrolase protein [Suillus subalutaceus]KAG1841804.1 P-loop containing nucleoside triphosphate hydrolase protein [Suillus subalutaceus]
MTFNGHACITTLTDDVTLKGRHDQSYYAVCKLIEEYCTRCGISRCSFCCIFILLSRNGPRRNGREVNGLKRNRPKKLFKKIKRTAPQRIGPEKNKPKNIILFGETGADKSSLVNLMAGREVSVASPDLQRCTMDWEDYIIDFGDETYKVFDTIGVEEPQLGIREYLESVDSAYRLIKELDRQGGVDLLLFCIRPCRINATLYSNYKLFHDYLCEGNVPIVLVITHLEREMEDWWERVQSKFDCYGIRVAGHACILAADGLDGPYETPDDEAMIRNLVERFTANGQKPAWIGGDNLFVSLMRKLKELPAGNLRVKGVSIVSRLMKRCDTSRRVARKDGPKKIVLFGEAGAGKSSVVNLMAGKEVAAASNDMQRCTLHWQDYTIDFGGESYTVFDTVGLEKPQLGINGYLDSVENVYRLIKKLDQQGGIDLLLFCIRAGRLSPAIQSNYRLFHEFLCEKKVPIVLVFTHLEREVRMEDWWERQQSTFEKKYGFQVTDHACITAANRLEGRHKILYEESRATVRTLVEKFTADEQKSSWIGGNGRFVSLMRKLKELLPEPLDLKKKDIVSRLMQRCSLSPDVARQLAEMIKQG